ncbi:morphogenetic protein [Leclercia sp. 29361]|uniref:morphogenetic protein n=1 Tax=Leclercia sp. 29361 TaxID=2714951 RepID=UPI00140A02D9|nr:morphogenetic protein [Leclercia sp. 29361]QIK14897.1 morphogenetic protein [Leclercia sp. 29361]
MIFNEDMVRALLDGRKTQARRLLKQAIGPSLSVDIAEGSPGVAELSWLCGDGPGHEVNERIKLISCPYGKPGDRIWVCETWARYNIDQNSHDLAYRATTPEDWPEGGRWRPAIHMPRWASRILLEITDVRVERLQDITLGDICKEFGCGLYEFRPATYGFQAWEELWKSIYGDDSWQANPWVWVVEFKVVPNVPANSTESDLR